jgi:hypothetical protein
MAEMGQRVPYKTEKELGATKPRLYGPGGAPVFWGKDLLAEDFINKAVMPLGSGVFRPSVRFENYVGEKEIKKATTVLFGNGPVSIALLGDEGCGRGFFAQCYAGETGAALFPIDFGQLRALLDNWGASGLEELLACAKEEHGKIVLFVNEVRSTDSDLIDKGLPWIEAYKLAIKISVRKGVTVLTSINPNTEIETREHCDQNFELKKPNKQERLEIFENLTTKAAHAPGSGKFLVSKDLDLKTWAGKTETFSFMLIYRLLEDARTFAGWDVPITTSTCCIPSSWCTKPWEKTSPSILLRGHPPFTMSLATPSWGMR